MANPCAGPDPTLPDLLAADHCHSRSSCLFPAAAAAFENEALTSALRASMSPANATPTSSSYPTTPSSSSTSSASELLSGGHGASAPASRSGPQAAGFLGGTKVGRVTKRKPRPSRRQPTTYITADPPNFRRIVQEVTGFPGAAAAASDPASTAAPSSWPTTTTPACMLPTLDTSAFLLDRAVSTPARMPEDKSSSGGASPAMAVTAVEDDDSSVLLEPGVMPFAPAFLSDDFPTLDSWGII